MPTLVHIADAKLGARIADAGIIPGKGTRVVYFMPVTRDYFVSHQWLRELRRHGVRTFIGVYFRLGADELVWAGRYNQAHRQLPLGMAIREFMALDDPLGFELFVQRKILPNEITRVRQLPQKIGWRYMPHAHGRKLCGCPVCLPRGSVKSRALRVRLDPPEIVPSLDALKRILRSAQEPDAIEDGLRSLRRKRPRADPTFLEPLLALDNADVLEEVAITLGYFRHVKARELLTKLLDSAYPGVREEAAESLKKPR